MVKRKNQELKIELVNTGEIDINVAMRNIIAYAAQKALIEQNIKGYTIINPNTQRNNE
ncbi:hypothetical protein ACQCN2_16175 [Brevibacillus ginsengisoli]|uniref:hypothetical protein n=1 Tax=Brevibacillus ginsengisoli TaxID=363854 RepID=UPI003CF252A2